VTASFDPTLPAIELARDLLGRTLVRIDEDGGCRSGIIVETEAYPGGEDLASHSRGGRRTPRNTAMFLRGGHLYVYLIYGLHHCLNVVSGAEGAGEAVLVRAIRPVEGIERMRQARAVGSERDLARGPGRLCAALGIDRSLDAVRIGVDGPIRIEGDRTREQVVACPRVGVENSGDWASRPWRFLAGDARWWSRRPSRGVPSARNRP
jgi:DNA-3-methyladenine glycosylase